MSEDKYSLKWFSRRRNQWFKNTFDNADKAWQRHGELILNSTTVQWINKPPINEVQEIAEDVRAREERIDYRERYGTKDDI